MLLKYEFQEIKELEISSGMQLNALLKIRLVVFCK